MIETYIPLYRKYRPQALGDLVGQEVVATTLSNALGQGKIAHAYLFCGPRGTGKTSSARILAKSLNCAQGPTVTPCQNCPSCKAVTEGHALDVTEIDAASNNGVDNIRDLTDKVQFTPIEGKYKVYIIDEVHMLSTQAFNALLKTLEEPPPNVVFIFATTEPHKVLPTIVSRCQRFDFQRITREGLETRLQQIADLETIAITSEALKLIARFAHGGMRDALGLLDQVAVMGRANPDTPISVETVCQFIGMLESDLLFNLMQGILDKDPAGVLAQLRYLETRGVEPSQAAKELTLHVRNLLVAKTCGPQADPAQLDVPAEVYARLCEQAAALEIEELPQMLNRLSLLQSQLKGTQQPQLWLEVALLDLAYRQDIQVVKTLAARLEALEAHLQSGIPLPVAAASSVQATRPQPVAPMPPHSPVTPAPSSSIHSPAMQTKEPAAPPPNAPVGQVTWLQIMNAISHPPTKALLEHFSLVAVTDTVLTIGYNKETLYETFKRTDKIKHLDQAIQQVYGKPFRLEFTLNPVTETSPPKPQPTLAVTAVPPPPSEPAPMAQVETGPVAVMSPPMPVEVPPPPSSEDPDLAQAKQYTQSLLQARILE